MSTTLLATPGRTSGSAEARRLRRDEKIPAVIYGQGMTPVSVIVDRRDLRIALSGAAGTNTILEIKVGNDTYPAVVKEMQRHPVRRTVAHVDFMRINMSAELHVNVPVHLHGEAKAVLSEGGLVDAAVDTIEIITTPANMPNEISIDVSGMQPHDVIRLGDIKLPAGCRAVGDPETAVVTAISTRAATEAAAAPAAEAPKA